MKRIAILIISFSIILMNFASVSAASAKKGSVSLMEITDQKLVEVKLSDIPETINQGETLELTATTLKHGSDYEEEWNGAIKDKTVFDAITGAYVSKAVFKAEKPGTYTISYCIYMSSGGSTTAFYGKVEKTITVINPVTVVGAGIRNLVINPVYGTDGSIITYLASGSVYAIWSDQSATPCSSIFFSFGPDETVKNVDVTFTIGGVQYYYTVTVSR